MGRLGCLWGTYEYMLFTEPAYRDLAPPEWEVEEGEERYDDIGDIKTYVYYPPEPEPYVHSPDSKPSPYSSTPCAARFPESTAKWRKTRN